MGSQTSINILPAIIYERENPILFIHLPCKCFHFAGGNKTTMEIKWATAENVRQPKGGLILVPDAPTDYILGALDPKGLGQVLVEDGHWAKFLPEQEIQRVSDGDTYMCTAYSDNNVDEMIHKRKYGFEINLSDRFVGVGSGNVRGQGNSMKAPAEFKRKNGVVMEVDCPITRDMILDQVYAPLSAELLAKGKENLNVFDNGYLSVAGTGQTVLLEALKVSPIKVAIEGNYVFDSSGKIKNTGEGQYNHAVTLFDYVKNESGYVQEWWIFDSETEQFLRFSGSYAFISPLVKFFSRKTLKLLKKKGQSAICLKHWSEPALIAFSDGAIPGGDLFKSIYGVLHYSELPREDVDEWPYPIKYLLITNLSN